MPFVTAGAATRKDQHYDVIVAGAQVRVTD
jgi:hypothetical protein